MGFDLDSGFLGRNVRIFDADIVGRGDLSGQAFHAMVCVIPDQPPVAGFDIPLGGFVQ